MSSSRVKFTLVSVASFVAAMLVGGNGWGP